MIVDVVLRNYCGHVFLDFVSTRNWCRCPRLESIPKCVEVAIRANTWIRVHVPRSAERLILFKNDIRLIRRLLLEVIRRSHSRYSGSDNQNIKMFCPLRIRCLGIVCHCHRTPPTCSPSILDRNSAISRCRADYPVASRLFGCPIKFVVQPFPTR